VRFSPPLLSSFELIRFLHSYDHFYENGVPKWRGASPSSFFSSDLLTDSSFLRRNWLFVFAHSHSLQLLLTCSPCRLLLPLPSRTFGRRRRSPRLLVLHSIRLPVPHLPCPEDAHHCVRPLPLIAVSILTHLVTVQVPQPSPRGCLGSYQESSRRSQEAQGQDD
jgi:hypothetical protein